VGLPMKHEWPQVGCTGSSMAYFLVALGSLPGGGAIGVLSDAFGVGLGLGIF